MNKSNELSLIIFLLGSLTGVVSVLVMIYRTVLYGLTAAGICMPVWSLVVCCISYPRCRDRMRSLILLWLFFLSSCRITGSVYDKDWIPFSAFMFLMIISVAYMWFVPPITGDEQHLVEIRGIIEGDESDLDYGGLSRSSEQV